MSTVQHIRARRFGSRGWIAYSATGTATRPMRILGLAILAARLLP